MKATIVCRRFLFVFSILGMSAVPAFGQAFSAFDAEQLKAQVNSQQKMLQKQEAHIEALESTLAEQQRIFGEIARRQGRRSRPPAGCGTLRNRSET